MELVQPNPIQNGYSPVFSITAPTNGTGMIQESQLINQCFITSSPPSLPKYYGTGGGFWADAQIPYDGKSFAAPAGAPATIGPMNVGDSPQATIPLSLDTNGTVVQLDD